MDAADVTGKRIVVTGASSGIGAATVGLLSDQGADVIAVARREDRLREVAESTGADAVVADLATAEGVSRLAEHVTGSGGVDVLVNNAGGARGADSIEDGEVTDWEEMYQINVLTTLRTTQALLPALRQGAGGDIVVVTSTAAHDTYPGGGGYVAAKHAERVIASTLRLELVGEPIRVIEIAPGMVKTEEFALRRLGDAAAAEQVYAGVAEPLVAEDVAEAIRWTVGLPRHVNIDSLVMRPVAQASNTVVDRR
ncbi:MAG TPA: SDR family oxidoreductase [Beutenbergiaceae bacterium]|nr:SDR family oxidoreductase [Beutenbergiaceae bacterium]